MIPPSKTRTSGFPIGFRRGGAWQQDLAALIAWAREFGFASLDLTGGDTLARDLAEVSSAGLQVGSVDLCDWGGWPALISPDAHRRAGAVAGARARIELCARAGVHNFFALTLPEKPALPRTENFAFLVESCAALAPALEAADARLVIEGWPGMGALVCTPETYRALFRQVSSAALGVNYDPSHLVRMGIDPLRFLREFASRVYHVHGKDTSLADADALYEFGHELPPTFAASPAYGSVAWRYTIPGHGRTNWMEVLGTLQEAGYRGGISVELEDANYHGGEEAEKRGLLAARRFLEDC